MFKDLYKLKGNKQLYIIAALFIILFALFWPRDKSIIGAGLSAHIGNLGAKINLEAYETFQEAYHGKTLALFYAPWCPHCTKFAPEWENAVKNNGTDIKMVKIDCDKYPDIAEKHEVKGFPTIYFLPYGLNNPKDRIAYDGPRKGEALLAFIANK